MTGHGHGHGHSDLPAPLGPTAARVVVGILVAIAVAVAVGAVALWPGERHIDVPLPFRSAGGESVVTESGTVLAQDRGPCGSASSGRAFTGAPGPGSGSSDDCTRSVVGIESGPDQGDRTLLEIVPGPGQPDLRVGAHIRLVRQTDSSGTSRYAFDDYSRGLSLLVVVAAFACAIVGVARWRGLRALVGLGVAFAVLTLFTLPALLDSQPPVPVALVSGAAILYAVLYLAHGVNLRTSSALLGTLASMALAAGLSVAAIGLTNITGLSEDQNTNVQAYVQDVSITGLLLAGFIIGSLGVLNDVTITQAATAFELAAIDPTSSRRAVFTGAMRVGRDHIASTVYTLVLAYAGGALPLLLLFSVTGGAIGDVVTSDIVAVEIVRSCVGGIALALSVPLTTAIATLLARPPASTARGRHAR